MDNQGHFLILSATFNSQFLTIVNIYASNVKQKAFYKLLLHKLQRYRDKPIIICGDFNKVADTMILPMCHASDPRLYLQDLFFLCRCLHGTERDYTLCSTAQHSYSRLDLIYSLQINVCFSWWPLHKLVILLDQTMPQTQLNYV